MESGNRNMAYIFIGAGIYLAVGHLVNFVSAGALLLAALGYAIIRSSSNAEHKEWSGYIMLGIAGLILLANNWAILVAVALLLGFWLLHQSKSNPGMNRGMDSEPAAGADPGFGGASDAAGNSFGEGINKGRFRFTNPAFVKQQILASIRWGRRETWTARSTNLSVAIAEIQIDLTNAIFEEPETTFCLQGIIGDIDIVANEDIGISVHSEVTIGEIQVAGERSSGFMNNLLWRSPNYDTASYKVQLHISYLIADVDVKVL